ncbi:hypothetical protein [Streptomyces mirabilis]|uniref:hypothetical protein n=1 Tax=Streptomyces mirabilis TaxID=68239 RepID=UPI00332BE7B5
MRHLVRKEIPDGVGGLVDTAGIAALAIRAVRDGGHVATPVGGIQQPAERGIETRNTFVLQYAREHAKLDRLRSRSSSEVRLSVSALCRSPLTVSESRLLGGVSAVTAAAASSAATGAPASRPPDTTAPPTALVVAMNVRRDGTAAGDLGGSGGEP